ncbi:carboxymuconolactone decarboxylase family protein [Actinocatenispora rupis]|uniref:Carboxymuconolactone decarboxylase n=1 Tax=Actinocatenispora rupis TaxID=519421 RepID=A0A8J3NA87_9ACTN|nr:carboxymuconolactone decarboxylase family protein [Actinocatenispora rupis]GID12109.1 carboxymuconolactone decarboxylase [Actinocatenispora rupis]
MTVTTGVPTTPTVPDPAALDPVFAQMAAATVGQADALPTLTAREKTFLHITADVCQQCLGLPFELHVRAGLRQGVSTADVRALLRLISYDTGYHAALAALERLADVEERLGLPRPDAEPLADELVSTGPDAARSPLPEQVRAALTDLDPAFLAYFELQSRMRLPDGPGTLTVRERAFTTMSVDVHYQTLGETFRIHIDRALRGGATVDDVRVALAYLGQFGATRAWQAWRAFHAHAADAGWTATPAG